MSAALLRLFDSVQQWQQWRADYYWPLLAWRLLLYAALTVELAKVQGSSVRTSATEQSRPLVENRNVVRLFGTTDWAVQILFQNGGAQ